MIVWVPCAERLPDLDIPVLITREGAAGTRWVEVAVLESHLDTAVFYDGTGGHRVPYGAPLEVIRDWGRPSVVAWAELPEPSIVQVKRQAT